MRHLIIVATFALGLTACEWNTDADYNPKAEFKAFVKKQEQAAKNAAEALPGATSATPAATGTSTEATPSASETAPAPAP